MSELGIGSPFICVFISMYVDNGSPKVPILAEIGVRVQRPTSKILNLPQGDKTSYGKISTYGELVTKSQYMNCMQGNVKCYWWQSQQQNKIIVTTCTIVHPCSALGFASQSALTMIATYAHNKYFCATPHKLQLAGWDKYDKERR